MSTTVAKRYLSFLEKSGGGCFGDMVSLKGHCPIIDKRCDYYVLVHVYSKKNRLLVNGFQFCYYSVFVSDLEHLVQVSLSNKLNMKFKSFMRKFYYEIEIVSCFFKES